MLQHLGRGETLQLARVDHFRSQLPVWAFLRYQQGMIGVSGCIHASPCRGFRLPKCQAKEVPSW